MNARASILDLPVVFLATFGLHLLMMEHFPIIYGGDPVPRLVNFPKILLGHQLPLLQVLIHCTMRWFYGPVGIWVLMGIISALGGAGFYALTGAISQDRRVAQAAALLYFSHPFILYYSCMPYQEPLLLAGIAWGFYYLFRPPSRRNSLFSSLFLGGACLTRYEGWIAAAVAAVYFLWERKAETGKISLKDCVLPLALFGWAPFLWIVWNRGLSQAGTYVLDGGFQWAQLYRPYFVVKTTLWWSESAVAVLGLVGFAVSWAKPRTSLNTQLQPILCSVVLFLGVIVFSGHGIQPDPVRLVTEREAFVPICLLILYAAVGWGHLSEHLQRTLADRSLLGRGIPILVLFLIAAYALNRGIDRVAASNLDPELKTEYEVAQFLAAQRAGALILANPLPEHAAHEYLRHVERSRGPEGRQKAQELLKGVDTGPLDYQRVLMFSWLGKERIVSADRLHGMGESEVEGFFRNRNVEYLVVFTDFLPTKEHEQTVLALYAQGRSPEQEIRNGDKGARIYRVRS